MLLDVLRLRTRHLHDRVERAVDLPARLRSPADYAALVARLHGFYAPLEDRLAAAADYAAVGLVFEARRKAHLLRDDLAALGRPAGAAAGYPDLPAPADLGGALGCLYVLEGATLGGRVVCRQAAAALGVAPGRGCSFFASYGDRVGPMWAEFLGALGRYGAGHPGAEEGVAAAAADTFRLFGRWVEGGGAW